MSDLAQFVAATIRDKVVLDLLEENKRLRNLINKHNTIEITGENGYPTYLRAQQYIDGAYIVDSKYKHEHEHEQSSFCPLNKLPDIEIRMGRAQILFSLDHDSWGFVDRNSVLFLFEEKVGNGKIISIEISLRVEGWPEERWHSLERVHPQNMFITLVHSLATTDQMKVKFIDISVG